MRSKLFYFFILALFYPSLSWAGDCVLVPITGNGSDASPYRPSFPAIVNSIPGFKWTASIPSKPDGSPQYPDAYVCFPDGFKVPPGLQALPPATAAAGIKSRDPQASLQHMANLPPAVIKGSMRDYRDRIYRFAKIKIGMGLAWAASATDTFTGTGALSGSWSVGYGSEGTPTRVSDGAECATGSRCVASYNALVPGANQYAQGNIMQWNTALDGDAGPAVRMPAPTSFDGYFARCGYFGGPGDSTLLQKRVAGASSTLGNEGGLALWTIGNLARLEITGTGLTLYRNGTPVLTATDSTHTGGRGGMMLNSSTATSGSETARLDNFEVGDLGSAAPTRRRVVVVQ